MATILISGATRGVGREAARRLIELEHTVYIGARSLDSGKAVAEEIGGHAIQLDVTDDHSVAAAVEGIDSLDILINNAGIAGEQLPPPDQSIEDMQKVFDTNVLGPTRMLRAFAPLLEVSAAPVVVNVSSAVGSLGRNSEAGSRWKILAYPMSKAALNMLTIQYAKSYPRWRVNAVTPGLTATEFSSVQGGWSVEEGADILVQLAVIGPDGPTGSFFEAKGVVPW